MILIQKCKEFLQILHKGIMLHSPQIERKEDSYTVEPNARCQRNFLRGLLKCMLMIIFLQHPDHPVHRSAWNEIASADPRSFPIPGPDFFFCPTPFHRNLSLSHVFFLFLFSLTLCSYTTLPRFMTSQRPLSFLPQCISENRNTQSPEEPMQSEMLQRQG